MAGFVETVDRLLRHFAGVADKHAHGDLTGLTSGDPHTQYATNTEFDDHNARHEPAGADPMAVDAAAATGSLRTLGVTSTSAATGDHVVPVMVASGASHAAGHVPDPGAAAGTTKYLREDGTWQTITSYSLLGDPMFWALRN